MPKIITYTEAGQARTVHITDEALASKTLEAVAASVVPQGVAWVEVQSAPAAPIEDRRAAAWERIKLERERRRQAGVLVGAHWFHSNDTSRIQQIGLVMMGAGIPAGLLWRTMDNGEVPMTQALASSIFQAVAASDAAHFEAAKLHRAAMELALDPDAYDFSAGWPAIYAGA